MNVPDIRVLKDAMHTTSTSLRIRRKPLLQRRKRMGRALIALAARWPVTRSLRPTTWSFLGPILFLTSGMAVVATASVLALHIS